MKKLLLVLFLLTSLNIAFAHSKTTEANAFPVRGFHLDLSFQVMKMGSLKHFVLKLS